MKEAARLNGDLLSRKGEARPVPGFAAVHGMPIDRPIRPDLTAVDAEPAGTMPECAERRLQGNRVPDLKCDKFGRVRISLRLDHERHLRLRLLAAHGSLTLQEALIAALDAYLGEEARNLSCECLHLDGGPSQDNETPAAGVQDPE